MNSAGPWREPQAMASAGEKEKSLAKKEEEEEEEEKPPDKFT